MNKYLLKKVFNSPSKKCDVTKIFYPASLMVRLIQAKNAEGEVALIPDNMYSKVNLF